ncbi:MAG: RES family NAD+ phosphorylase [Paracoccaceae bacterium]
MGGPSPGADALSHAGPVFRAVFRGADPLAPAGREGRFHRAGQFAIYTSLSPEGCAVAIRRYLRPDDPPREIVPLWLDPAPLADRRGQGAASVVWQDIRAGGEPSPTWAFSDAARAAGAGGMLYSSRSRPDLTHLVVFCPGLLRQTGAVLPFPAP